MLQDNCLAEKGKPALLIVDVQPDFMPGGALPVPEGDLLVEPIRALVFSGFFELVVASQDWHPPDHVSFAGSHPGKLPFESIELYGRPQVLWPDHCVQGTKGAKLHKGLPLNRVAMILRKGADRSCDSYSAFRNNWNAGGERPRTGLAGYLKELGVQSVCVCGLARDFCVKWSAEDAAAAGFRTSILWDLTRPVNPEYDDRVRRELISYGVRILNSHELEA